MTGLGQTRTSADVCGTTASPPEADISGLPSDVAEGPQAVIAAQKLSPPIRQKKRGVPLWSPSNQLVGTRLDAKDSSKGGRPSKEAIRKEAHQDDFQRLIRVQ